MNTGGNILSNTRYFRYLDDTDDSLEVIRILKYQNIETLKYEVIRGDRKGEKGKISISDLREDYTKLEVDGIISVCIVSLNAIKDVMVTLMRRKDIEDGKSIVPFVVCRQCISDIFSYAYNKSKKEYFGLSISQSSCPENVPYENFIACNAIDKQENIAYYIGDNVLKLFDLIKLDEFNNVLVDLFKDRCTAISSGIKFIYDTNLKKSNLDGYCKDLIQLLDINNFE